VLGRLGLKIVQVSRTRGAGTIDYSNLGPSVISTAGLIVNTTPLGMYPDIASKPDIDYTQLTEKHILFDLVYNPEITSFLQAGIDRGCRVITGLKMLHSQAEKAWEIWNDPDV
jgi:shikimate dehydrogenase